MLLVSSAIVQLGVDLLAPRPSVAFVLGVAASTACSDTMQRAWVFAAEA
jgi:hypothetical protein